MGQKMLLLASSAKGPSTRVPVSREIRSDSSSGKSDSASELRSRYLQLLEKGMADKGEEVGLILILREDQLSLHKKYSALIKIVDTLSEKVQELTEELQKLQQTKK